MRTIAHIVLALMVLIQPVAALAAETAEALGHEQTTMPDCDGPSDCCETDNECDEQCPMLGGDRVISLVWLIESDDASLLQSRSSPDASVGKHLSDIIPPLLLRPPINS